MSSYLYIYIFFNSPLPRGSRPGMKLFSEPTWRIGGVHWATCFFVLVVSFTLLLENFISSLGALIELYEIN